MSEPLEVVDLQADFANEENEVVGPPDQPEVQETEPTEVPETSETETVPAAPAQPLMPTTEELTRFQQLQQFGMLPGSQPAAPAQPAAAPPMSQEEVDRALGKFSVDEAMANAMTAEDPHVRQNAIQDLVNKTVKYAVNSATGLADQRLSGLEQRLAPAEQLVAKQQIDQTVVEIQKFYPQLKGSENHIRTAIDLLKGRGFQASSPAHALSEVAGTALQFAQVQPAAPAAQPNVTPAVTNNGTGAFVPTSTPKSTGGGAEAGGPKTEEKAWRSIFK